MDGGRMEWVTGYGAGTEPADLHQRIARLATTVEELRAKVELDGEEIDALQAAARTKHRWWREPSLVVSVLAVVLAGVATYLTQAGSAAESENAKRQQLASNVQRINSLERESADLAQRSPELAGLTSGAFTADYGVLASQSADLIDEIPDRANPTEYLVVCRALYNTGDVNRSRPLCEEALRRTHNLNEAVAGMRQMGFITAMAGDRTGAAEWYRRATTIHTESARYGVQLTEPQRLLTDFATEIFWHAIDAQLGDCGQRKEHLRLARSALERVPNFEAYTLNVTLLRNAETATTTACGA